MVELAQFVAAYALLLLLGVITGGLLALLLVWSWAGRYGPVLGARYAQTADRLRDTRWMALVRRKAPWLQRMSPRTPLVWLPLSSFAVLALSLHAFAELADGIGPNQDLHVFDKALSDALRVKSSPAVLAFFSAATRLGDGATIAVIGAGVGLALVLKRRFAPLYAWVLALAGSGLLNVTLKAWFERDRPGDLPLLASWSFPSGHAMNSMAAYGMLAYLLSRNVPRRGMPVVVGAAVTIVLLVGASRIFLGYHYFSDVLAGFAAGLAWLSVCITVAEVGLRRERKSTLTGRL
jgi:undecaprenyl-diphosphatase